MFGFRSGTSFLLVACMAGGCAEPATDNGVEAEAWAVDVGFLDFPTSGSPEAQRHFLRGVSILHSFGYKQAIEQFQLAQQIDPDFALAYWGETFCYNHPLLPERDLDKPREVLTRLGASTTERLAKAPTEREKDFVGAVEVLWGEGEVAERRLGYMAAMQRMHERYPGDDEVAAFYALSLLSAWGPSGDTSYRLPMQAGAIALGVFARNPDHPGAAHYVIHAFDDPIHAPLALPAAWRFAEIAAAVSHARHMPSHIFIQRGLWDEVSRSNDSAYEAAEALWEPGDAVNDTVHALDWGHYGDLQRGDAAKARRRMEMLDGVVEKSEGARRAVSTQGLLWARLVVETEQWETRPVEGAAASELLVTAIAALRTGDLDLARAAAERLAGLAAETTDDRSTFQRGNKPTQVAHHQVAALIALADGDVVSALHHLDEGLEVAENMGPPRGPASPVKPVHELYGEVLLELERYDDAAESFRQSLLQTPNRSRSLLGLARASVGAGDRESATDAYRAVLVNWGDRPVAEAAEAREYVADAGAQGPEPTGG